jgi:hypothetical protein
MQELDGLQVLLSGRVEPEGWRRRWGWRVISRTPSGCDLR